MRKITTYTPEETHKLAGEVVGEHLKAGRVVALHGNLGAGKTTFVQGLAQHLGVTQPITSPTFVLMKSYQLNSDLTTSKRLIHIDLYRLEDKSSQQSLGLTELLKDPENIVVIEWADKLGDELPNEALRIYFEVEGKNSRTILVDD